MQSRSYVQSVHVLCIEILGITATSHLPQGEVEGGVGRRWRSKNNQYLISITRSLIIISYHLLLTLFMLFLLLLSFIFITLLMLILLREVTYVAKVKL